MQICEGIDMDGKSNINGSTHGLEPVLVHGPNPELLGMFRSQQSSPATCGLICLAGGFQLRQGGDHDDSHLDLLGIWTVQKGENGFIPWSAQGCIAFSHEDHIFLVGMISHLVGRAPGLSPGFGAGLLDVDLNSEVLMFL